MWGEWYPVFSAICYFGSLGLLVVVHVPWVGRRYQQFRKRDWAFGLLVAGMVTRSLWRGIQEGAGVGCPTGREPALAARGDCAGCCGFLDLSGPVADPGTAPTGGCSSRIAGWYEQSWARSVWAAAGAVRRGRLVGRGRWGTGQGKQRLGDGRAAAAGGGRAGEKRRPVGGLACKRPWTGTSSCHSVGGLVGEQRRTCCLGRDWLGQRCLQAGGTRNRSGVVTVRSLRSGKTEQSGGGASWSLSEAGRACPCLRWWEWAISS
jgi:hypothetical protein